MSREPDFLYNRRLLKNPMPLNLSLVLILFIINSTSAYKNLFRFNINNISNQKVNQKKVNEIKSEIIELATNTKNGVIASENIKKEIGMKIKQLEELNQIRKLTNNNLLAGKWNLLYTTNDGSSAGKIGPFVGKVIQDIDFDNYEYDNIVDLIIFQGILKAKWVVLSNNIWQVEFVNLKFKLFDSILLKEQKLNALGEWRMTFLDDNFRILYAKGGKNKTTENVYVLNKEL